MLHQFVNQWQIDTPSRPISNHCMHFFTRIDGIIFSFSDSLNVLDQFIHIRNHYAKSIGIIYRFFYFVCLFYRSMEKNNLNATYYYYYCTTIWCLYCYYAIESVQIETMMNHLFIFNVFSSDG